MGFFARIRRLISSSLNETMSKHEDPERMLNQIITDMQSQLVESKKKVAGAIADEKRLQRQMQQQYDLASEWEEKAVTFVEAGRDDSAKEALLRKQEYLSLGNQYKEQYEAHRESVIKLKAALQQLQQRLDESIRQKSILIARVKRAKAHKEIQEHLTSLKDSSAFEAFDQMTSKVEALEAETEALGEIESSALDGGDPLEAEYKALKSSQSEGDKLLADLKKKISGELEAPEGSSGS